MSCNIRDSYADDKTDSWPHRSAACAEVIASRAPDLIGFQEMTQTQWHDLLAALQGYAGYGQSDTPRKFHPRNAVFYRRDRFVLVTCGGFALSDTPHVCGSMFADGRVPRVFNWVELVERASGVAVRYGNTHLDHLDDPARPEVGQSARLAQAGLIDQHCAAWTQPVQLLSGDLNVPADNAVIARFLDAGWVDTWTETGGAPDPCDTYHGFQGPECGMHTGKIDFIFRRGRSRTAATEIVTDTVDGRFPSDHYFLVADIDLLHGED